MTADFFIQVTGPRKGRKNSTYHVMRRFKAPDDPFEKVERVASCEGEVAATSLQELFDRVRYLEKSPVVVTGMPGTMPGQSAQIVHQAVQGSSPYQPALLPPGTPHDAPQVPMFNRDDQPTMPRDKPPAPEVDTITQPKGPGDMATGVVRTPNRTKKKNAPGKRQMISGRDIPALRGRATQAAQPQPQAVPADNGSEEAGKSS